MICYATFQVTHQISISRAIGKATSLSIVFHSLYTNAALKKSTHHRHYHCNRHRVGLHLIQSNNFALHRFIHYYTYTLWRRAQTTPATIVTDIESDCISSSSKATTMLYIVLFIIYHRSEQEYHHHCNRYRVGLHLNLIQSNNFALHRFTPLYTIALNKSTTTVAIDIESDCTSSKATTLLYIVLFIIYHRSEQEYQETFPPLKLLRFGGPSRDI